MVVEIPVSDDNGYGVEVRGESFHMNDVLAVARAVPPQVTGDRMRAEIRVRLRREPHNPHDPNAILVLAESGVELGHVCRELAAEYAPVFDRIAGLTEARCCACVYGRLVEDVGWRAGVWLSMPDADLLLGELEEAQQAPG
jgi:HIRAN domain